MLVFPLPPFALHGSLAPGPLLLLASAAAVAGGPKYVAGVSFFNPGVVGQPVHWANGQLNYYVDQGPLNSSVTNQQAKAMVDAAAAVWNAVPTAGVALTDKGSLNEDVIGANIVVGRHQLHGNQRADQPDGCDHRARRRDPLGNQLSVGHHLRR
jgi:hypothetical protein